MKNVLTIAGSDSCGGAGIQADLKTMSACGVYGMSVITAITAQNSKGVFAVQEIELDIIKRQFEVLYEDIRIDAIKIGMLSSSEISETVYSFLKETTIDNIILDPVMVSKSGYFLLKEEAISNLKKLISISKLVTPNIPEAEILSEMKINNENDMIEAGLRIKKMGAKNVLIKGGHRTDNCTDILINENSSIIKFYGERISTINTHGTGCSLSSAITSFISKGYSIEESITKGKEFITLGIKNSFSIGEGVGPIGHFIELYKKAGVEYE